MGYHDLQTILCGTRVAVALASITLIATTTAWAADLDVYPVEDEMAVEQPYGRRQVFIEQNAYDPGPVDGRYTERRALPPFVERHVVERPVIERRIIERRVIPPVAPRVVQRGIVVGRMTNSTVEPVPVPPQYVPPVRVQRHVRPVFEEPQIVGSVQPVEECRVLERRYLNEFGKRVTETIRTCD